MIRQVESIEPKMTPINGQTLANYIIDYGLGTTTTASYKINRVDSDYFVEEWLYLMMMSKSVIIDI